MKHFGWDYEGTEKPHYQIFPVTPAAEQLMGEESLVLFCERTPEAGRHVQDIIFELEKLANLVEPWDAG